MEIEALVQQAYEKHMMFAKPFYRAVQQFLIHSQERILLWLWMQDQPRASDIIDHFDLSAGRVSIILKELEEKKFIVREKSGDDRRNTYIMLTDAGIEEAEINMQRIQKSYRDFFSIIGTENARMFLKLEDKLIAMTEDNDSIDIL